MEQESAFLQAIQAEPDEDVHRLAYADWLTESDHPAGHDRGEFIRVQCQLARLHPEDPARDALTQREASLLDRHRTDWTDRPFVAWLKHPKKECRNPLGHRFCQLMAQGVAARCDRDLLGPDTRVRQRLEEVIDRCGQEMDMKFNYHACTCTAPLFHRATFRRGFIDTATVQDYFIHLFAEAVFDLAPVRDLTVDEEWISDLGDEVARGLLRGLPRSRLRRLGIVSPLGSAEGVKELVGCPHLAGLVDLDLFLPEQGEDEAVEALADAPHLSNLRRLRLISDALADESLRALLDSPHLAGLTEMKFDFDGKAAFSPELWARYEARFGRARGGSR